MSNVRIEQCAVKPNNDGTADIPIFNVFNEPKGEKLSKLCILRDCRPEIAFLAKGMLEALKVANGGPGVFFLIENLSS